MLLARVVKRVLGDDGGAPPPVKEILTRQAPVETGEPVMARTPMLTRSPQQPVSQPAQPEEPSAALLTRTPGQAPTPAAPTVPYELLTRNVGRAPQAQSSDEGTQGLLTRGPFSTPTPQPEPERELLTRSPALDMGLAEGRPAPSVPPSEAGTGPLLRDVKGRAISRPQMHETGDRLEDLGDYRRQLEDYRNPRNTNNNWLRTAAEVGLGFLQGGIPGAAVRGLRQAFNPNLDERQERDRELARVQGMEQKELLTRKTVSGLLDDEAERNYKGAQARELLTRPGAERLKQEQSNIIETWKALPEFDPDARDPQTVELIRRASAAQVTLPKKEHGDRFTFVPVQSGDSVRLVRGNTRSGEAVEVGTYAKPAQFKLDGLEERYGLKSDKQVETEALARVAPARGRRLTPQGRQILDAEIKWLKSEEGGSVIPEDASSEEADNAALNSLLAADKRLSDVYEGVENDDELKRRIAAEKEKIGGASAPARALVARLKSALLNYRAPEKPAIKIHLDKVLEDFNTVLAERDPKKQKAKADDFFDTLGQAEVTQ